MLPLSLSGPFYILQLIFHSHLYAHILPFLSFYPMTLRIIRSSLVTSSGSHYAFDMVTTESNFVSNLFINIRDANKFKGVGVMARKQYHSMQNAFATTNV